MPDQPSEDALDPPVGNKAQCSANHTLRQPPSLQNPPHPLDADHLESLDLVREGPSWDILVTAWRSSVSSVLLSPTCHWERERMTRWDQQCCSRTTWSLLANCWNDGMDFAHLTLINKSYK